MTAVRKVPIIPTIIVIAAAAVMVMLGVWQLGRADDKDALLAQYEAAAANDGTTLDLDIDDPDPAQYAYRQVTAFCEPDGEVQYVAGRSGTGQAGYVGAVGCRLLNSSGQGDGFIAVLGWTERLGGAEWDGGEFTGTFSPMQKSSVTLAAGEQAGWHIVADPPQAGLQPVARPDPSDIPNNHLAYAGQWFFFALTALLIYGFALRRRWRDQA